MTPTLLINNVYAVEVPDNTIKAELINKESWPLCLMCYVEDEEGWFKPGVPVPVVITPGSWQLIGTVREMTEDVAKGIVEEVRIRGHIRYEDYTRDFMWQETAADSLTSLLASKGLDTNKNWALVRKGVN
jgi:hypothetical protein